MALGIGLNTLRQREGVVLLRDSPAERRARLEPYWRMVPEGESAAMAGAVVLSGCDGVADNMTFWAEVMAGRGHPALILDSHAPRGFDEMESWRLLCAGQALPGAQRAGDLAVALAETQRSDVILLGASHGGWTVLEALNQLRGGTVPPGLDDWPAPPETMLGRIAAVVVLYPYCGILNRAADGDWHDMPPILMILAAKDELKVTPDCQVMANDLRRRGARIEVALYDEAGHGFDQKLRSRFSGLEFNADLRSRARQDVETFLTRVGQ
jgi:dienelactone hydrolase